MLSIEWMLVYALLGAFIGFMAGLLGVGGGGILVPLLTSIFIYQGIALDNVVHLALGTSLACIIISSAASLRAHASRGVVIWKVVHGMSPGVIVGAFATTRISVNVNSTYIAVFFALFMALVACQMLLNWQPKVSQRPLSFGGLFFMGIVIGSVSSLAAVGGGFLAVTYLGYKRIEMRQAVGTSAAIGLPIALASSVGYMICGWAKTSSELHTLGFVHVPAFLVISTLSVITVPYGARFSCSLPDARLKKIFALISLVLSARMLFAVAQF